MADVKGKKLSKAQTKANQLKKEISAEVMKMDTLKASGLLAKIHKLKKR